MQTIIVRHKVGDLNRWLKGHQERLDLFAGAGATFQTFQDANDANSILLVVQASDPGKLAAVINDPANAQVKAEHTVMEPITMSMQVAL